MVCSNCQRPLKLTDDLHLLVGEPGFQLIGGNDGDASRARSAADAGPVVGSLGGDRQLGANRQIERRHLPCMLNDATLAAGGTCFDRCRSRVIRTTIELDRRLLGLALALRFRSIGSHVIELHSLNGQIILDDKLDRHDGLWQHVQIVARRLP